MPTFIRNVLVCFLLAIFTNACTTVSPPSAPPLTQTWSDRAKRLNRIESWQLTGKIAVRTQQDSGSATLNWAENQGQYTIRLLGPLGAGGLKLSGHPGSVTLEQADGKRFSARNPEELLLKQWGYHLPVSYLRYWIRGLPVPGIPERAELDAFHRISSLKQQGFKVEFANYLRVGQVELPARLTVITKGLNTTIVIHQWDLGSSR
ncbi:MAG: outer membrane lipoprotein LolB [Gammaproteobacteria bacterium RIFCSPHIGHO2_12_FULL_43_28]|nr:MAG: outer membrane lipoprotein LolB [Gammaproteobacteria bacterium RIFCSPHIGHO2_12_FULL_43_28]